MRESLDTTSPGGLVFHVFASIAEFERDVIRERTMAGREAARARGRKGRRKPVIDEKKIALASRLMIDREVPIGQVCEAVGYPVRRSIGTLSLMVRSGSTRFDPTQRAFPTWRCFLS